MDGQYEGRRLADAVRALAVETAATQLGLAREHDRACQDFGKGLREAGLPLDEPVMRELAAAIAPPRMVLRSATVEAELTVRVETQWGVRVGLDLTLADPLSVHSGLTLGRQSEDDLGLTLFAYERRWREDRTTWHWITLELAFEDEPNEGTGAHA